MISEQDIRQHLQEFIGIEATMLAVYTRLAAAVADPGIKRRLSFLRDQEQQHQQWLHELLALVATPDSAPRDR